MSLWNNDFVIKKPYDLEFLSDQKSWNDQAILKVFSEHRNSGLRSEKKIFFTYFIL
jgi:hypothetical protein